jgi:Bacterial PH domain
MRAVNLEKLLPSDVPSGEHILWFGRPDAFSLLRRAYRADFVAGWFVLMSIWNFALAEWESGLQAAALSAAKTLGAGALALLVLALLAWLTSRMALYVITTRRVVLKVGIALPIFFNIPFTTIRSASLRTFADKTGDIPLALGTADRIAYFHLWPHARPFRFTRTEPAMRSVVNAAAVAEVLSRALIAASNQHAEQAGAPAATQPIRPEASPGWRDGAVAVA